MTRKDIVKALILSPLYIGRSNEERQDTVEYVERKEEKEEKKEKK